MRKCDLVQEIAHKTGARSEVVASVMHSFIEELKSALLRGERVELRGFGVFFMKSMRPKMARNFQTGESIPIPAKLKAAFKPSRDFMSKMTR